VIDSFSYIYDRGERTAVGGDSSGPTTNYTYNSLGELTAAGTQAFSFDAAGNPDSGGDSLAGGRILLRRRTEHVSCAVGRSQIHGHTLTYTYDTAGNVATAVDPTASTLWSYGYDNANNITSAALSVSGDAFRVGQLHLRRLWQHDPGSRDDVWRQSQHDDAKSSPWTAGTRRKRGRPGQFGVRYLGR